LLLYIRDETMRRFVVHAKGSNVTLLFTTSLICAGAGLLAGNRLVKTYDWRTEWFVPAPLPTVYEALTSRSAVRQWWPSMQLVDEGGSDELRAGSRVDFSVQQAPEVARLAPPFVIHCVYTDVEPERRLREVVTGDLTGVLETLLDEVPDGTRLTFTWYVRVTNPVLNLLGYVAERVYRHSHDTVMSEGEEGLRRYCAKRVRSQTG
jgi:uncharacterized protein YndB with AHSA1/START domain